MSQIFMVSCFANIEMFNACFTILLRYQFKLLGDDFKHIFSNALHKIGMPRTDVEYFMNNREEFVEYIIVIIFLFIFIFSKLYINKIQKIADTKEFKSAILDNLKFCIHHHQDMLTFKDEFYGFISFQLSTELLFLLGYLIFSLFTVTIVSYNYNHKVQNLNVFNINLLLFRLMIPPFISL